MTALATDPRATLPDLLARRGFRLTGPRRAVLDVLVKHGAPLSVAEIHSRLPDRRVNLVSVYRTLYLLSELGLLRTADTSKGSKRFELSQEFTGHHHHLICQACGLVQDLEGCSLEDRVLETLTRRVRRVRGFRVTDHDLKLFGLCARCAPA